MVRGELAIGLFASEDIPAGIELTFDYNFERYGDKVGKCVCPLDIMHTLCLESALQDLQHASCPIQSPDKGHKLQAVVGLHADCSRCDYTYVIAAC